MTYTCTKRHNGEVVATNIENYFDAFKVVEQYPNCDIIIHPSNETMMEYQVRMSKEPYDITQGGWAFL